MSKTKQEEIREDIKGCLATTHLKLCEADSRADTTACGGHSEYPDIYEQGSIDIMKVLHSQDVVIKVEEISDNLAQTASQIETYYADKVGISSERTNHVFKAFKEAGYVEAVPLIEER